MSLKCPGSFLVAVSLAVILVSSCVTMPQSLSDGERSAIATSGGKPDLLEKMLAYQHNEKIDSALIFKNGEIVLERYWNGYDSTTLHDLRSATKAITALLVGIAIDNGMISSVDNSILDYFPERVALHPEFGAIRIRDLLTMSSGLNSDDWDQSSPGNEERMYETKSWIDFFFSLRPLTKPGQQFHYSTAGVVLLGELVKRASRMQFEQFADLYLFRKLGIVDYAYARTPAGEIDSGGHLKMKPRDFAKFGILMLQNGKWKGEQIVSESWIKQAIEPAILVAGAPINGPYMGFLWWQEPVVDGKARSFQARGNGGQYLIAVPTQNILGVFTGSAYNDNQQMQPFLLMKTFVIPAFGP